ncbi:hypothetical protein [Streptomyces diastaticus]|uniref:hypothetical protein n=1 Tax=Streptomyces diastaticus TaxID=1956 RepID=UPI0036481BA1
MDLRGFTGSRHRVMAAACAVTLSFAISACGGSEGEGKDAKVPSAEVSKAPSADVGRSAPEDGPLAEVNGNGITLTVDSAVRDGGGFLTVSGKVTNGKGSFWTAGEWKSDESELSKSAGSMAGATIVDAVGKKKYLILRDTGGRCLCTLFEGGIDSNESVDWFAQFPAPPDETSKVQLQVPTMPPATIEISEG